MEHEVRRMLLASTGGTISARSKTRSQNKDETSAASDGSSGLSLSSKLGTLLRNVSYARSRIQREA